MMPGRRAGLCVGKYKVESPKQGSKRFNFITKMIFAHLGVIFIYGYTAIVSAFLITNIALLCCIKQYSIVHKAFKNDNAVTNSVKY